MSHDPDTQSTIARLMDDLAAPRCHEEMIILSDRVFALLTGAYAATYPEAKEKPRWLRELALALEQLKKDANSDEFLTLADDGCRALFRRGNGDSCSTE